MKFISTANPQGTPLSFKEAVLGNLPSDGGLYFPQDIPQLSQEFLESMPSMHMAEVAFQVLKPFCEDSIPEKDLRDITQRVFDFPLPLVQVGEGIQCVELFHGPTFAFKDIGARFLAECLAYFNRSEQRETTVLVATSGDTGGAVANGFLGVEGVNVIILYPKDKVSLLQEKQLTTLGQNITALEVEGTFDDCQTLVKQAFADDELNQLLNLSSANSINIARWLPQSLFYYVPFIQGLQDVTFSVPSGNYGNLTSGVLAMKMGLPIRKFIAASNANDAVPRYLESATYDPQPTIATIANAMDVSDPSNFKRLLTLFGGSYEDVRAFLAPYALHKDQEISQVIRECKEENDYLIDPHSAIAYQALKELDESGIFLGTAHYCKFLPVMNEALDETIEIPDFAKGLMEKEKVAKLMKPDFGDFTQFLKGE